MLYSGVFNSYRRMDDLKIIINTLSAEDKKDFGYFIQRQKKKKHRKDYELLQLLQSKKDLSSPQLIARLYPDEPNAVAYYALRKRLMHQLTDFVVLKRMEEDPTAGPSVMGLISLANYLFDVRADRLAWTNLRKAEKLALLNEQFDLLNAVYNLQIAKADNEFADNLEEIIAKRNQNKRIADEDERANIANSLIKIRLHEASQQGRDLKFDTVIKEVLTTYGLTEAISLRPSLFYKLMSIARSAVLARKDFYAFEPYIIEQYKKVEEAYGFSAAHQQYKINLLYMIAHVLYRNRKFKQSNDYLAILFKALATDAKNYLNAFYPKYIFLKTANDAFLSDLTQSVILMEDLLRSKAAILSQRDTLTARLGLSFLYFAQEAYQKANRELLLVQHSDKWCERLMGKEWLLKKNLGELIIQYEFGNLDNALDLVKNIQQNFKPLFQDPVYKNVAAFLQLLVQIINQPDAATRKAFFKQVDEVLEFVPAEQQDLQAMSFYAWLKSKMTNRRYYDVLLQLANSQDTKPVVLT